MKPQIIVALDIPSSKDIPAILDSLPPEIFFFKIGLELFTSEGPAALAVLKQRKKNIFLDLKMHDIPRTVANAVKTAAIHGVSLLTIHASGGRDMLSAAAKAARELGSRAPRLLAVTTLTSLGENDIKEIGISRPLIQHTLALGELAIACGIDGIVCSPLEAADFRRKLGPNPILVTPGIRMPGADAGDQKRIATPRLAVEAGANYLVVGRPILDAPDRAQAARRILEDMRQE